MKTALVVIALAAADFLVAKLIQTLTPFIQ